MASHHQEFGFHEPLLALFFAFGLFVLVLGLDMYYDDWEEKSRRDKPKQRKEDC